MRVQGFTFRRASCRHPAGRMPGRMPGSTAGETPAATPGSSFSDRSAELRQTRNIVPDRLRPGSKWLFRYRNDRLWPCLLIFEFRGLEQLSRAQNREEPLSDSTKFSIKVYDKGS